MLNQIIEEVVYTKWSKDIVDLAKEAIKYKSGKEFEEAISNAVDDSRENHSSSAGDMMNGIRIGEAVYGYKVATKLRELGFQGIQDFYIAAKEKYASQNT